MPFHFRKKESPAKAVRRVCREHINEALGRLRKSRHPAAVHGVRKEIKKLRAIFRLMQGKIKREDYRKTAKTLRRTADCLAAPRDARVRLKAAEKLTGGGAARRFPKIHQALQENCRRESRRFRDDDSVALAKRLLRKISRRVGDLQFNAVGWVAMEPGLRQSYRRGRVALQLARRQPSPENFHEWRKHVKHFWYALRLLCPEWPAAVHNLMEQLEQLGELLGDEHDLVLLKQFIAEHCSNYAAEAGALTGRTESARKKLRAKVLKLGVRLYAETPVAICTRLGKDWTAWRDGK